MKTKDQIKTEIVRYVEKCQGHLFTMEPESKWVNGVGYTRPEGIWEIKIILKGDFVIVVTDDTPQIWEIDHLVNTWGSNARCVLKGGIFRRWDYKLGRNLKVRSIPLYKRSRLRWVEILNSIRDLNSKGDLKNTLVDILKKGG